MTRAPAFPYGRPAALLVAVVLLGILAYSNTFGAPFVMDDTAIRDSARIRELANIPSFFVDLEGSFGSRPLMHATFALNYHFGGLDPSGYHAFNLAVHLLNGGLLYLLVSFTGRHMGYSEKNRTHMALLSAAIFILHPVQTEAVTNVVNRSMLLAATFFFLGLMLFLKAVTAERRRGLYLSGLLVVSFLGIASREDFAMFPLILLLYDMCFVSRFSLGRMKAHLKAYLAVLASLGYLAFLVTGNTYGKSALQGGVPPVEYGLTQFKIFWTYARLILLPVNQTLDYDYPLASSLFEFSTLLSFLGYAGLWAAAVYFSRRRPVLSFLLLWPLIVLLPISFGVTFLDLKLDDVIFEHRLYLASAGIIVAFAIGLSNLKDRLQSLRPAYGTAVVGAAITMALAFSGAAYARNSLWTGGVVLWSDVISKAPNKARGYNNRGEFYMMRKDFDSAIRDFDVSVELEPYWRNHHNAAVAYGKLKSEKGDDKAFEHYLAALRIKPDLFEAHNNIGIIYFKREMYDEAARHFAETVRLRPKYAGGYFLIGAVYLVRGMPEHAENAFSTAIRIDPGHSNSHKALGDLYMKNGDTKKAEWHYEKAKQ